MYSVVKIYFEIFTLISRAIIYQSKKKSIFMSVTHIADSVQQNFIIIF